MAELVPNSGAVNNKPPFEMGVGNLDELLWGITPCLHLLKVSCPMNYESTLRDAECFFGYEEKSIGLIIKTMDWAVKTLD